MKEKDFMNERAFAAIKNWIKGGRNKLNISKSVFFGFD